MNYELIEEIKFLKSEDKTEQEIANFFGMSKQTIFLILRIEKVLSDHFNSNFVFLENENKELKEKILDLENELQEKNKLIDFDCISLIDSKKEEIENLKDDLMSCIYFEDKYKDIQNKYLELISDFNRIPNFIKNFFLR